jgi:hypothetical protein
MGFGGKMEHAFKPVPVKQLCQQICITDAAVDKGVPGIVFQVLVIGRVAGIGQGIQVDNMPVRTVLMNIFDKIGSDKSGSAGNQYLFHGSVFQHGLDQ